MSSVRSGWHDRPIVSHIDVWWAKEPQHVYAGRVFPRDDRRELKTRATDNLNVQALMRSRYSGARLSRMASD